LLLVGEPWHYENAHHAALIFYPIFIPLFGLGSYIDRGLFVGWVEHPDIFCWVSFLYPTFIAKVQFSIKLVVLAAGGRARMKLRLAGTVKRLNIDVRCSLLR
jgi:hypothetical protein